MKEIGSEFWTTYFDDNRNKLNFLKIGKDYKLLMSGRTAISFILDNIEDMKKIVYMPNYCCKSMLQPFLDNNYKIVYYNCDVINNKYDIDSNFNCSIFFAMSYFGYDISNMDTYIELFNKKNIIVIEDITHRLLSDKNHSEYSTFLIASLRKWFPILSGGIAINMHTNFKTNTDNYKINKKFINTKKQAMNLKREYMCGSLENKDYFLELFNKSNHMIEDYKNMKIDEESIKILKKISIKDVKEKRIENCKLIEQKLKNNKHIKLLYKYKNGDCPLFVPIIINNRNYARKKMIENNIYLPVHWPNDGLNNDIYNVELSLIIDQRYSKNDIEKYIDKLIEIVGE